MRPLLPTADKLLPYLQRIDENRWYSNSGPLAREFEDRLGEKFSAPCVTASSATSALTACLIALNLPHGSKIAVPSWTFCATVNAIIAAWYEPYFIDVQKNGIASSPPEGIYEVACSPFGMPVVALDKKFREQFCTKTEGGPLVMDAASGFSSFSEGSHFPSSIPKVFSTHCTKSFSTGEGGFVVCPDEKFLQRVREILNNGFTVERSVEYAGINGKMSEYHAAVGLAELDGWEEKRERWLEVQELYGDDKPWVNSTHHMKLEVPAAPIVDKLAKKDIQARTSWYGTHRQPAYRHYPRTDLGITEDLMDKTIFLPKWIGMTKDEVNYVQESLTECL